MKSFNYEYQPLVMGSDSTKISSPYDWRKETQNIFELYDEAWKALAEFEKTKEVYRNE